MNKLAVMFLMCAGLVSAQAKADGPGRQAILDYKLDLKKSNQLITAMTAMTKYVVSLPDYQERLKKTASMTPAQRVQQIANDPKAMAIIRDNGLTPRDYLVGVPALRMALIAAQSGRTGPLIIASQANIDFAKANLAELKPKMDAADGIRAAK